MSGAVGDSGLSYGVQIVNSEADSEDQNLVSFVNSLGTGASLHFEHLDKDDATSHVVLKVDF